MKVTPNTEVQRTASVGNGNSKVSSSGRFLGTTALKTAKDGWALAGTIPVYTTSSVTASRTATVDASFRT